MSVDTTNGRFDNLPKSNLNPSWKEEMISLASRQREIGDSGKPVLVVWNIDKATESQLKTLKKVIEHFLRKAKPEKLMISGRRSPAVAKQAQILLHRILTDDKKSTFQPKTLITGGADGVDSIALRIGQTLKDRHPNIIGQFTPTPFARADVSSSQNNDPLPSLDENFDGLTPGASPLCATEHIGSIPNPSDSSFREFLSIMEGQWEARDTHNAESADACLAFLTVYPKERKASHDGTKSSLNIFTNGRYAHPLKGDDGILTSNWEVESDERSHGVVKLNQKGLNSDIFVGYKIVGLRNSVIDSLYACIKKARCCEVKSKRS